MIRHCHHPLYVSILFAVPYYHFCPIFPFEKLPFIPGE